MGSMYFTKYPHRANFSFAEAYDAPSQRLTVSGKELNASVTSYEGDIYHVQLRNEKLWEGGNKCLETLNIPPASERARLKAGDGFHLTLLGKDGKPILSSVPGESFGVSGDSSMFVLTTSEPARFYGLGEKTFNKVELSGLRTKFWTTDVWGDFHHRQFQASETDPAYVSVPYLALKIGEEYVGLLLHNPYPTFIETPGTDESRVFVEWQATSGSIILGSEGGEPNLWVIYGTSLADLTRKLQKLVGVTPLPPAWSLGYHQSRWGYAGHDDLVALDAKFNEHKVPCDGLWMDLEYMRGFRIFNTSKEAFPNGAKETADILKTSGRRIVPILDPGVKFEAGYNVYDDGHAKGVFCKNVEGKEFIGLVWPGETVFPDFTLPEVRDWWAGYAADFRKEGYGATWVDMNDPSTGPVDPTGMLFQGGKDSHYAHHNQYALGMQMATRSGFLNAFPNERPFILTRSGFIGTSKHAAIWTGDNISNWFYLAVSIPEAIGMSLSGLAFAGPDVGGFGDDVTDELMTSWIKTCFLFPFFRNHSVKGCRPQEPFSFPEPVMHVLRRFIRLRYKLMPYLYNLFVQHEELADPILRPLFYHYDDKGLDEITDEFLIGADILQAPFVHEDIMSREVILPGTEPWYDAATGKWVLPGTIKVKRDKERTPLFVRAGAVIPMQQGTPIDNRKEFRKININVFVPDAWTGESEYTYVADDGLTYDYQKGVRSSAVFKVVADAGKLDIVWQQTSDGFGAIEPRFVIHGKPSDVTVNGEVRKPEPHSVVLAGAELKVSVV